MIKFEKPEYKIAEYIESNHFGKFELDPLERGFGTTIGNALRRVMLSSLPGSAITSVAITGVMHEFQKIEGIVEDVTTIVLNLKKEAFVPVGGGKDSCVTINRLKKAGMQPTLFSVNTARPIADCKHIAGLPEITIKREISPVLLKNNEHFL